MGYKLAGFDVIGCNEIDARIIKLYQTTTILSTAIMSLYRHLRRGRICHQNCSTLISSMVRHLVQPFQWLEAVKMLGAR